MRHTNTRKTFDELQPGFERLRTTIFGIIKNALDQAGIDTVSIESRVKSFESFNQKIEEKGYRDPFLHCNDFVGIRVIVYLESDVDKASDIIRNLIDVDVDRSVDKRRADAPSSVGYRSLHLVGCLGTRRAKLPEYEGLTDQAIEVQIRTALQHAWAAIEHKRNYKGANALPVDLEHRLMVLAGVLELVDKEFSRISQESDEYNNRVISENDKEQDDPLTFVAARAIIDSTLVKLGHEPLSKSGSGAYSEIALEELADYGVKTIKDFRNLLASINLAPIATVNPGARTFIGIVRDIMIAANAEKYLQKSWKDRWQAIGPADIAYLERAAGRNDLERVLAAAGIDVEPSLDFE